jgi:hypothetical protein
MLSEWAQPLGVVLTLLVLVLGVGWALWRAWGGPLVPIRVGLFDLALVVFVILAVIGIPVAASYKRAATLTVWAWVGFVFLAFLTRQLLVRAADQQSLLAVLLATVVALSVGACYHTLVDWSWEHDRAFKNWDAFLQSLTTAGMPTQAERDVSLVRILGRAESGPFLHPAAFAGLLILLLPALVGAVVAAIRSGLPRWCVGLAVGFAGITLTSLAITRQPLAVVALLVVGLAVIVWYAWTTPLRIWGPAMVGLLLLGLGARVCYDHGWLGSLPDRTLQDRWAVAERAVNEHPWFGLGGSHFALFYPHHRAAVGGPRGAGAGNFLLQLAAEFGVPALVALLIALGVFFVRVKKGDSSAFGVENPKPDSASFDSGLRTPDSGRLRWEFQVGGSLGLLLGFFLRASLMPEGMDDRISPVITEAIATAIRAVVWFAALLLFERIPWSEREFQTSLRAGVAALLLFWLVSDGIGWPSLVGLLWVVVALGLSAQPVAPQRRALTRYFPVPVMAAIAFGYFVFLAMPTCISYVAISRARAAGTLVMVDRHRPEQQRTIRGDLASYLERNVLLPLRSAKQADPDYTYLRRELGLWSAQQWQLIALTQDPRRVDRVSIEALVESGTVEKINPLSPEGALAEGQIRLIFVAWLEGATRYLLTAADNKKNDRTPAQRADDRRVAAEKQKQALEQLGYASEALERAIKKDPTNLALRFEQTELLAQQKKQPQAAEAGRALLKLNEQVPTSEQLAPQQRERIFQIVVPETPVKR